MDVITENSTNHTIILSDSLGMLFIVSSNNDQFDLLQRVPVTKHETSIWRVKVILTIREHLLIFTGSDDGSLKAHNVSANLTDIKCVIQNSDASSGVTSINSLVNSSNETLVVTGSYDEHLRIYQPDTIDLRLNLLKAILIPGSGIWKIRILENQHMLLAGMYSGIHEIDLDGQITFSRSFEDESSIEKNQLIYDVIKDGRDKLLIASFYKKMLISITKL